MRDCCRLTFTGELTQEHPLGCKATSVFALDINSSSSCTGGVIGSGAIALGGAGGCVEVLSRYGATLCASFPVDDEYERSRARGGA